MRLFAVTLMATRHTDENGEFGVTNGVALLYDDEDVDTSLKEACNNAYPEAAGWCDQEISYTELEQNMVFRNYCVSWTAHEVSA